MATSPSPKQRAAGQVAVAATADGILAIDPQGIIQFCNPSAARLLGRQTDQLIGAPVGFPLVLQETTEIDIVRPDGRASALEVQVTTTTWDSEALYIAALRDVTHRRHAVRTLQAALDRRDTVIAVTAHELSDPLYAIELSLQLLRKPQTEERRAELLDQVGERTEHLQALVGKLRTASKIDAKAAPAQPEPVDVLEFVLERLGAFGKRYQDVRLSCRRNTMAFVDRRDLSEMLSNYLENALAYGDPPIEIEVIEESGWVKLQVRDHGPGLPKEFVPRLYERFARGPNAERHVEGTGLGLWIVRNLARTNGGDAWYEPQSTGGPTFCLRLPRATAPPQDSPH